MLVCAYADPAAIQRGIATAVAHSILITDFILDHLSIRVTGKGGNAASVPMPVNHAKMAAR
jgi:hypothetical protein